MTTREERRTDEQINACGHALIPGFRSLAETILTDGRSLFESMEWCLRRSACLALMEAENGWQEAVFYVDCSLYGLALGVVSQIGNVEGAEEWLTQVETQEQRYEIATNVTARIGMAALDGDLDQEFPMLWERVRQLCRSHPTADPVPHGEPLAPLPDWLRRAGNLIGDDDSGERLVGVADSLEPQDHGEYGYGILIRDVRTTR